MRITDELREWMRVVLTDDDPAYAIADRIDAEHKAKVSYWQGASYKDGYDEGFASADDWLAQHEDAMAEHGWVKLPVDSDGVPIRPGDVMEWCDADDIHPLVVRTVDAVGTYTFIAWKSEEGKFGQFYARNYRHHHATTVEDVLREFALACEDAGNAGPEVERIAAEYAAKLQLKESE